MTYQLIGPLLTKVTKLADNTATTVFTANQGGAHIASIVVIENNGGTPTLTLTIVTDAGTIYYLRKAVAMTAGTAFIFNTEFLLPPDWLIKVTSSSGTGDMDVLVNYIDRAK
jgi:EamA domain-containing membrane protein RarD